MAFYSSGATRRLIYEKENIFKKKLQKEIGKKLVDYLRHQTAFLGKVRKVRFLSFHKLPK